MSFDPAKHHRRSIRLKGHDYAGGGLYFVTLCAHRDAGNIFAQGEVKSMIAREWESAVLGAHAGAGLVPAQNEKGTHEGCPYTIMPDHFHALIRIAPRGKSLGDVIGAFKSRVVHEYIQRVKAGKWPPFPGKIWHRNYYERIVRTPEAAEKISRYIRMNPWRCVNEFGSGLRGIGNPALWNASKTGILCSRNGVPDLGKIPEADVYLGGFHSPPEKGILAELLARREKIIYCPAWGLENVPAAWMGPLEENRMLLLEMGMGDMNVAPGTLAAAEQRNRFVIQNADRLWVPHVTSGGMLDRLLNETTAAGKRI
jgi:hypothetical protein